jgi:hypothetical protein
METWRAFLWPADEWIAAYASLGDRLFNSVQLFGIGHATELYLKACHAKLFGNCEATIKLGHNIRRLFAELKAGDSSFMPGYELRDEICNIHLEANSLENIPPELFEEYTHNYALYTVALLLPDLKYFGTPMKGFKGRQQTLSWIYPDYYWIGFFRNLRAWLGHPCANRIDVIAHHLRDEQLPDSARRFLSSL